MRIAVRLAAPKAGSIASWELRGSPSEWSAVIVDVLRATSTLTLALANGARGVEAFADPALAIARRGHDASVLACGERDGRMVDGFDLGNSPLEYRRERVEGRTLAFASTNGSLALLATAGCARRTLGAFINATAVLQRVREARPRNLLIACAGKLGGFALEDTAFAGWLCASLVREGATLEGAAARMCWAICPRDAAEVRAAVEGSSHGRTLRRMGEHFARDVEYCAGLDRVGEAFDV